MAKKNMTAAQMEAESRRLASAARKLRRAEVQQKEQELLAKKVDFADKLLAAYPIDNADDHEQILSKLFSALTSESMSAGVREHLHALSISIAADESSLDVSEDAAQADGDDIDTDGLDSLEQRATMQSDIERGLTSTSSGHHAVSYADIDG